MRRTNSARIRRILEEAKRHAALEERYHFAWDHGDGRGPVCGADEVDIRKEYLPSNDKLIVFEWVPSDKHIERLNDDV